ncbi:epoxide hydrolase family protein [Gluconacetobacter asukensis]|uniref:Epoxide hydrolase n=1 Tax=Gluconacetobacter asukensis TaxID=1017181 RepID=A0A7W4J1Q6_9PROT|nr:epoxide hydrolase family protein [Gluconacetobacter asukensis]MBB2173094.1 epoxide hydrolase [Gluconacetobacter asukensis]
MGIREYKIHVSDDAIADLRARLQAVRWPVVLDDTSWADGASLTEIRQLVQYWLHNFDWRSQEQRLNCLPQFLLDVGGTDIHFVHQKGIGPAPIPLILTHGWPGSFCEMEHILPLLTDPGAHGGDPADAFDVVIPSLPGFGFSARPTKAGTSSKTIAMLWRELMCELGYERFATQGGDIGAGVSMWLARLFPESILGAHVNYIPGSFKPGIVNVSQPVSAEENSFLERAGRFSAEEGAYSALQATKPQTLAFSLTDSPVGLAAWIAEKFHTWTDRRNAPQSGVPLDVLLTDISLYWFSENVDASLRLYKENRLNPLAFEVGERVDVPLGVAVFPYELPTPPRSWVERVFPVTRWTEMPAGGHFAALEQPKLLAEDIRAFFRPLRQ